MSTYLWIMSAGAAALFALYGLRCAKAERLPSLQTHAWETALLSLLFSVVFGTVLARVGYALMTPELDFENDGIGALSQLLEFDFDCVSFFFGAVGVCLGVLLANRLLRKGSVAVGMDAFAPFGALLIALFRMGEYFSGTWGAGRKLGTDSLAFFPFAVKFTGAGGKEYWVWAVFVLSAVFALACAALAFFRLRGRGRKGFTFTVTLFFLCLTQILCESLRNRGIRWLFVHAEQLLCAVVLLVLLLFWILRSGGKPAELRKWLPVAVFAVCVGLLVVIEFVLGGKLFELPLELCYAIMCALLAVIGVAGMSAVRRWNAAAGSPAEASG